MVTSRIQLIRMKYSRRHTAQVQIEENIAQARHVCWIDLAQV